MVLLCSWLDVAHTHKQLKSFLTTRIHKGSALVNLRAAVDVLDVRKGWDDGLRRDNRKGWDSRKEWDELWRQLVADLLDKYLVPLVLHSIVIQESKLLRVTYLVRTRPTCVSHT